jgi:hypothetical protein
VHYNPVLTGSTIDDDAVSWPRTTRTTFPVLFIYLYQANSAAAAIVRYKIHDRTTPPGFANIMTLYITRNYGT